MQVTVTVPVPFIREGGTGSGVTKREKFEPVASIDGLPGIEVPRGCPSMADDGCSPSG